MQVPDQETSLSSGIQLKEKATAVLSPGFFPKAVWSNPCAKLSKLFLAIGWATCYNVSGKSGQRRFFTLLLLRRVDDALQTDKGRRDEDGYILWFDRVLYTARRSGEPVLSGVQR